MKHAAKRRWFFSGWVTAAAAFVLSLAVFSAAFLVPWFINRWDRPESAEVVGEQGHSRTLWLMLHDADRLTAVLHISADTGTLSVTVTGYPSHTEVVYHTALCPLWQCYTEVGIEAVSYLEAVSGETADAAISMSVDAFGAWVSQLGNGIPYTLSQPVEMLPQGEQFLTPLQIADVLRFEEWENTATGQAEVNAHIVTTVIDRHLNERCDLDAAFSALTALCEQHLTISQFTVLRPDLQTLAGDGVLCTVVIPHGRITGVDKYRRYVLE